MPDSTSSNTKWVNALDVRSAGQTCRWAKGGNVIVLMIPETEVRDWLLQSAEAVLDKVSELVEAPQDDLLAGMAETMRQRLGLLLAVRSPAKSIPMARGRG